MIAILKDFIRLTSSSGFNVSVIYIGVGYTHNKGRALRTSIQKASKYHKNHLSNTPRQQEIIK
jgi:hypothetical protein